MSQGARQVVVEVMNDIVIEEVLYFLKKQVSLELQWEK